MTLNRIYWEVQWRSLNWSGPFWRATMPRNCSPVRTLNSVLYIHHCYPYINFNLCLIYMFYFCFCLTRGMNVCPCFSVFALSCVGSGLATGRSPYQMSKNIFIILRSQFLNQKSPEGQIRIWFNVTNNYEALILVLTSSYTTIISETTVHRLRMSILVSNCSHIQKSAIRNVSRIWSVHFCVIRG